MDSIILNKWVKLLDAYNKVHHIINDPLTKSHYRTSIEFKKVEIFKAYNFYVQTSLNYDQRP